MRRATWLRLLITSGLATTVTAVGSLVSLLLSQSAEAGRQPCEQAARYLQDESPHPYVDPYNRRRVERAVVARFERCMKE